ncbi:MAG: alpha/beta hydrolase [Burkholderiales bacterium]
MPAGPKSVHFEGPSGNLEAACAEPDGSPRGLALIAHPHPLYGGTMENKVVQTLSRTFVGLGLAAWRVNFRGVGASEGVYDDGRGEVDDFLALAAHARSVHGNLPLTLAGFSFGGYVAAHVAQQLAPERLVLVAPAVGRFPVSEVPVHTLVIHGEADDVVSLSDVLDWARPQKLPVVVVPGAGHFFHGDLLKIQQVVRAFTPLDGA